VPLITVDRARHSVATRTIIIITAAVNTVLDGVWTRLNVGPRTHYTYNYFKYRETCTGRGPRQHGNLQRLPVDGNFIWSRTRIAFTWTPVVQVGRLSENKYFLPAGTGRKKKCVFRLELLNVFRRPINYNDFITRTVGMMFRFTVKVFNGTSDTKTIKFQFFFFHKNGF
jgi:hypothetical protein